MEEESAALFRPEEAAATPLREEPGWLPDEEEGVCAASAVAG